MQVEHYRPKATINLGGKKSAAGYHWLAASFTNLLPSCVRCNSPKEEFVPALNQVVTVGKSNWFPLEDEKRRATKKGDEVHEVPLLLNPCVDDPEKYLRFDENGIVSPIPDLSPLHQRKAEETISILGLGRESLIKIRSDHAVRVLGQIDRVLDHYQEWEADKTDKHKDWVIREWEDLNRLTEPDSPYLAMARKLIADRISPKIRQSIQAMKKLQ